MSLQTGSVASLPVSEDITTYMPYAGGRVPYPAGTDFDGWMLSQWEDGGSAEAPLWSERPVEEMPLELLVATQTWVSKPGLKHYLTHGHNVEGHPRRPHVVMIGGVGYVINGHHRVCAGIILRARTVLAQVRWVDHG